jgi:hypothetical protein
MKKTENSEFLQLVKEEVKLTREKRSMVRDLNLEDVRKKMSTLLAKQYGRREKITSPNIGAVGPVSNKNAMIELIRNRHWL